MESFYGQGIYKDGKSELEGEIVLREHKLFLRSSAGEWAQSFIPLEKISWIRQRSGHLEVYVCLSSVSRYTVLIEGAARDMHALAKELAKRRGFKKRFLKNEWAETQTS